jgi:hypothetical protein
LAFVVVRIAASFVRALVKNILDPMRKMWVLVAKTGTDKQPI